MHYYSVEEPQELPPRVKGTYIPRQVEYLLPTEYMSVHGFGEFATTTQSAQAEHFSADYSPPSTLLATVSCPLRTNVTVYSRRASNKALRHGAPRAANEAEQISQETRVLWGIGIYADGMAWRVRWNLSWKV